MMKAQFDHRVLAAVLAAALLLFLSPESRAQRTANGTLFLDVSAVTPFSSIGGEMLIGGYMPHAYWYAGASGVNRKAGLYSNTTGENLGKMDFTHFAAVGGYMYRIYGTNDRAFNLYAGGGGFLGAEVIDLFDKKPEGCVLPYGYKTKFLYGIAPRVCIEWYFAPTVALSAGCRLPWNFSSDVQKFNYEVSLGFRFGF